MFRPLSILLVALSFFLLSTNAHALDDPHDGGYYANRLPDSDSTGHNPELEIAAYANYITQTSNLADDQAYEIAKFTYWTARDSGVAPSLVFAVMQVESSFKLNARNGGCFGLLQVNYAAHKRHIWRVERDEGVKSILDVRVNIRIGIDILRSNLDASGGDVERGLLRYNGSLKWNTYPSKVLRTQKRIRNFMVAYALIKYQPTTA